jgi:hypothetical protein
MSRVTDATHPGADTFRADGRRWLSESRLAAPSWTEGLVFVALLVVLGGLGVTWSWAPWAGACAALAFAMLMARDQMVRGRISLFLAPFYCLTVAGGFGLFILAGVFAGGVLLAH